MTMMTMIVGEFLVDNEGGTLHCNVENKGGTLNCNIENKGGTYFVELLFSSAASIQKIQTNKLTNKGGTYIVVHC